MFRLSQRAPQQILAHSADLKQELGLRDLVLTQVLFVVGLQWVGAAAKLGSSHVVFWLLAVVLFYVPLALVVIHLNRLMPLEGGLYQWAKLSFNELAGFMVAWNLWIYAVVLISEMGLIAATNFAYALGPGYEWVASSRWVIACGGVLITCGMMIVSILGLTVGKWVHNAGAILLMTLFGGIALFAGLYLARGGRPAFPPLAFSMPAISLFSLNILGKLGFGALGGFEYVAILAGECRNPVRSITRSVWIAAPIIAIMFIFGSACVLVFVRPEDIDLISPVTQVLTLGAGAVGMGGSLVAFTALVLVATRLAQASINFTATIRLPMVAGWDHLLPAAFTRLHPKYKTPVVSVVVVGATTMAFGLAGILDVGHQEAFQLLNNTAGIFYALTYLVMFAIPLFAGGARWGIRLAAASGLAMTLLYVALSIFPIIEVQNRALFTAKVASVVLIGNAAGAVFYWRASRKGANRVD
jgi:amino acid transporter